MSNVFCGFELELDNCVGYLSPPPAISICPMVAPAPVVGDRRRQSRSWVLRPVRGGR